jgi:hypothetical protein
MARNAGATEQLLDQRRNDGEDRVSGQLGWVAIGVVTSSRGIRAAIGAAGAP